ncbi:Uncharacterised protein [Mycobacteroides abscessus subsp. abscessus]|nr:Uncharacterised protein [Mycobacteroides abscessus subsp. abscessus]
MRNYAAPVIEGHPGKWRTEESDCPVHSLNRIVGTDTRSGDVTVAVGVSPLDAE